MNECVLRFPKGGKELGLSHPEVEGIFRQALTFGPGGEKEAQDSQRKEGDILGSWGLGAGICKKMEGVHHWLAPL